MVRFWFILYQSAGFDEEDAQKAGEREERREEKSRRMERQISNVRYLKAISFRPIWHFSEKVLYKEPRRIGTSFQFLPRSGILQEISGLWPWERGLLFPSNLCGRKEFGTNRWSHVFCQLSAQIGPPFVSIRMLAEEARLSHIAIEKQRSLPRNPIKFVLAKRGLFNWLLGNIFCEYTADAFADKTEL